jgi:TonB family protein
MKYRFAWLGLILVFAQQSHATDTASEKRIISIPAPPFPPSAIRQGHEGTVTVRVKLNANGEPMEVSVEKSSGYGELDAAAVKGAYSWRFRPRMVDGRNMEDTVVAPVTFSHPLNSRAPVAVPGPEFSCAKASTPTEKAICNDPELTGLEGGMDVAYRHRHFFAMPNDARAMEKEQDAFIHERATRCVTDVQCIKQMTAERLWQLPWDSAR